MPADSPIPSVEPQDWPPVRGVIFDLDGTLVDSQLDFEAIRRDLEIPDGQGVLETLKHLAAEEAERKWAILDAHEMHGANIATINPGVVELLQLLEGQGVPIAVLTRNSRRAADRAMERLGLSLPLVISRDDAPPKPDPTAIHQICEQWGFEPREVVLVGDFHYDLTTAHNAGCRSVLYLGGRLVEELDYAETAHLCLPCFTEPEPLLSWLARNEAPVDPQAG